MYGVIYIYIYIQLSRIPSPCQLADSGYVCTWNLQMRRSWRTCVKICDCLFDVGALWPHGECKRNTEMPNGTTKVAQALKKGILSGCV